MTTLTKLFSPKAKLPWPAPPTPPQMPEELQMPLRIIQAGGFVECYYMAFPAEHVIEKYPQLVLVRPEIFQRPWDSIVRPEEMLLPGEKFYLVPRRTLRKLQRRIRRPSVLMPISGEAKGSRSKTEAASTSSNTTKLVHPPGRKKAQLIDTWQPSLVAIDESSPSM